MKKEYLLIIAVCISGNIFCQQITDQTTDNFKKLGWLEGTWTLTNAKAGQSGHERWRKTSPVELRGYGVTMKGTDTVFMEKLRILVREDNLYYLADVPENKEPVYFKLTKIGDAGFVCENPDHDFPKKITYRLVGDKLKATISGNGKPSDYLFIKK